MQIINIMKDTVRESKTSKSPFIKLGALSLYFLWNLVNNGRRFFADEQFRSITLLRVLNSKDVHQTTPFTYMDRYPEIFSACRDFFEGKEDLKILSYGCSTGEEVLTLRKYFPNARIIGADINKQSLKKCRSLPVDDKITFIHSTTVELHKYGPYDAIFCMAVLQRQPHYIAEKGIKSLKKIYPFEKFEQQIVELDKLTKQRGLLVVHYTQYSFNQTSIARNYTALGSYNQGTSVPLFDRESKLLRDASPQKSIYKKLR